MTHSLRHELQVKVLAATVSFQRQPFVHPLVLSSGSIEDITQADAVVRLRADGREVEGRGCIYLSDLWAWPGTNLSHEQRDGAMRVYCEKLAAQLPRMLGEGCHPLEQGLRLHEQVVADDSAGVCVETSGGDPLHPPLLARSVCASIFDAAIHDAAGLARKCSAFDFYNHDHAIPTADKRFGGTGRTCRAIRSALLQPPRSHAAAWWIVGRHDDLQRDVRPAIEKHGFYSFKIKIKGRDAHEDASQVAALAAALRQWNVAQPQLSIDSNEANPDPESVMAFLDELQQLDPFAYERLMMIEQPTARDIAVHPFDWSAVAARKPVMVDEGLMTLDSLEQARRQHWSGFALKTCKGHSFCLAAAAWALQHYMLISLQDLTNPGASAIHAGLLAARLPTINGVELNSPQFTPAANADWLDVAPGLFHVRSGRHELPDPAQPGLGLGSAPQRCATTSSAGR